MLRRLVFFALSGVICATAQMNKPPHAVRASGEASIKATPDRAQVVLSVATHGQTAQAAAQENAALVRQVLGALQAIVGTSGEVKTLNYSFGPEYEYAPNGGTPKITGFRASNSVEASLNQLSEVGKLVDAAVKAGATNIDGISFTLQDDQAVRARALADAAAKARTAAEAIAKALNLHVLGVLDAETTETPVVRPVPMMRAAIANAPATPVEAGTLDVHASVTVTLQVE